MAEPDITVICDLNKLNLYMNAGVKEYWIVNPMNRFVYVYFLEEDKFKTAAYTLNDSIKVNIYDDLWIHLKELGL